MKFNSASTAGESRLCPHCKATILKSASSCPLCRHNLRIVSFDNEQRVKQTACPLLVEGTLEHPGEGEALEYSLFVEIRNENGKLLSREIIGVGALGRAERRIFSMRVEVSPAGISH